MGSSINKQEIVQEINLEINVLNSKNKRSSLGSISTSSDNEFKLEKIVKIEKSKFFKREANPKLDNIEYKNLEITVIESKVLTEGTKINLSPFEINGKKHNMDEVFSFGIGNDENDYNFPFEEKMGSKQFFIRYNKNLNNYRINDSNIGTGLFVLIDDKKIIDANYNICFSNNYIIFSKMKGTNLLKISLQKGEFENKVFIFNPEEKKEIKFGRSNKCDLVFLDKSVSRNQLTLVYENSDWYIYNGKHQNTSTNGVWFTLHGQINITDGLVFKSGYSTFKTHLK